MDFILKASPNATRISELSEKVLQMQQLPSDGTTRFVEMKQGEVKDNPEW